MLLTTRRRIRAEQRAMLAKIAHSPIPEAALAAGVRAWIGVSSRHPVSREEMPSFYDSCERALRAALVVISEREKS